MRHRLLTTIVLSAVLSALSLMAVVRILSLSTAQRSERAREAVQEEAARLASSADVERSLQEPTAVAFVGMQGGVLDGKAMPERLPDSWRSVLLQGLHEAEAKPALVEQQIPGGTLIICVHPRADGRAVWTGMLVRPPSYLTFWLWTVGALALATILLVTTALWSVIQFQRGANDLQASLSSLAKDLSTPVPRSSIRELAKVSDGIAKLARDLAQSREAQESLSRELAQKERLAALGRVVAGVAHEVRNPLASIKLHLDLAAATSALQPAVKKAVTHATEEIVRLDRLVADLLVVAGRRTGPLQPIALGALVRRRVDALEPWIAERQVSVVAEGDGEAMIDPESLGRAIDNLLRNAVEASPRGETVAVKVVPDTDTLRVRIEDHGVGIGPAHSGELFEPFFTTKPDGTGLGLAISRAIARAHGGEVSYQRREGTTTFELSLARKASSAWSTQERSA